MNWERLAWLLGIMLCLASVPLLFVEAFALQEGESLQELFGGFIAVWLVVFRAGLCVGITLLLALSGYRVWLFVK